jgi:hypothetical protein
LIVLKLSILHIGFAASFKADIWGVPSRKKYLFPDNLPGLLAQVLPVMKMYFMIN